ncbi:hypothetical protein BDV93DRAFT_556094 [Ceratobasidium sp. AG-I]|nr:hypothetical protein BDV93DRAFT_556094 [Ceratobasidium sp. AG-I]
MSSGLRDISNKPKGMLSIIPFERLNPITDLQGEAFMKAWLQCIRRHHNLWKMGIQRRNHSLSSFMVRTIGDQQFGIQTNLDEQEEPAVIAPFLAIYLLTRSCMDGEITVLYRHGLESFIWILVWVFYCYDQGNESVPRLLKYWQTADFRQCCAFKILFMYRRGEYIIKPGWTVEAPIARQLVSWLKQEDQRLEPQEKDAEEPDVVLAEFAGQLREASKIQGLGYLLDLVNTCLVN